MKYSDIKKFPFAAYTVHVSWAGLKDWLEHNNHGIKKLDMDPEYQRGYVWDVYQQRSYVEYMLKGGFSGADIFWNCPTWMNYTNNPGSNIVELVDGKQRIHAVIEFLENRLWVFNGSYLKDFDNDYFLENIYFIVHVNNLKERKDVVEWYLGFNTGGSIHTREDLMPAYELLTKLNKEMIK